MTASDQGWSGWKLVVVGDGEFAYVNSLKAMAAAGAAHLPPIEWRGPIWGADRWPYLQAADLFCLPTHSENFGIAVLEALHVGTPVLTTDQTPWAAQAGLPGLFIAKPEIPSLQQTLARARLRVGGNWTENDRGHLASWAEENFAWENLVAAYLRAYQRDVPVE
jgi:glycosyltransferase involved in cell wall biosynthesis